MKLLEDRLIEIKELEGSLTLNQLKTDKKRALHIGIDLFSKN